MILTIATKTATVVQIIDEYVLGKKKFHRMYLVNMCPEGSGNISVQLLNQPKSVKHTHINTE